MFGLKLQDHEDTDMPQVYGGFDFVCCSLALEREVDFVHSDCVDLCRQW